MKKTKIELVTHVSSKLYFFKLKMYFYISNIQLVFNILDKAHNSLLLTNIAGLNPKFAMFQRKIITQFFRNAARMIQ